jgi:molybdopterin-guanine dinucleotide biosynthesis protein A
MMPRMLGVVSAGGASRRFGSHKALAQVGGQRVIDRVAGALAEVVGAANVVAIMNDPALAAATALAHRPDALPDAGAIAGVHAALLWARERDDAGALVVGCDMPFVETALLRLIADGAGDADAVLPESDGRRGVEPLCAYYSVSCIAAIEEAVARGDARMIGFHDAVTVLRIPRAEVAAVGDPARMFLNINTPADHATAERLHGGT